LPAASRRCQLDAPCAPSPWHSRQFAAYNSAPLAALSGFTSRGKRVRVSPALMAVLFNSRASSFRVSYVGTVSATAPATKENAAIKSAAIIGDGTILFMIWIVPGTNRIRKKALRFGSLRLCSRRSEWRPIGRARSNTAMAHCGLRGALLPNYSAISGDGRTLRLTRRNQRCPGCHV